ncbi:MAG TPA: glycosyltransferase family 4 protein [Candidatus Paceibacterota bacterium]|jgi:glycosyltransferase involved in cell wall biosynthesis|nr:glycosyltransferase family 4 protein [Candidatus Paceibacterota bacterium]
MASYKKHLIVIAPAAPAEDGIRYYVEFLTRALSTAFPDIHLSILPWNYLRYRSRFFAPIKIIVLKGIRLLRADIVHIHYVPSLYLYHLLPILLFARVTGTRVVLTIHEAKNNGPLRLILDALARMHYCLASHLIVHSMYHKHLLSLRQQKKTTVIRHGVSSAISIQPSPRSPKVIFSFLQIGFIAPWKGCDSAIRAIEILRDQGVRARLHIVGKIYNRNYYDGLMRLVREKHLEAIVSIEGAFISDKKYETFFQVADAVLLPYRRVTMSGILSAAIAAGTPTIMTALEPFVEYTQSQGIYVPPNDPVALATAMKCLITDRHLYDRQRQLMETLREQYSWKNVAQQTNAVYQSLYE